jgi:putative toxin-antitoxin system antitoxin component (TIGR02293 family)
MAKALTTSHPRPRKATQQLAVKGRPSDFVLGLPTGEPLKLIRKIDGGLEYKYFEQFQKLTQLPVGDAIRLVAITSRTLQRRKEQGRLEPAESDRLVRASRVFSKALELFEGNTEDAKAWFQTPARALGNEKPIDLARTDVGAREVEALIDRLEQGILT